MIIENCKKGIIQNYCKECIYIEEKEWDTEYDKIDNVEIFHWNQCDCACVYCGNRDETSLKITKKDRQNTYANYKNL